MDFKKSSVVTQMVNDWAESAAEFWGKLHRDEDTGFLGFLVEKDSEGNDYFTAIYEADGYHIGVWWDGDWLVEDINHVDVNDLI